MHFIKKFTDILLFLIGSYYSIFGQKKYDLKIAMPTEFNNKVLYLRIRDYYSSKPYQHLDSAFVNDKELVFHGTIDKECELASLFIKDKTGNKEFYLDFLLDTGENLINVTKIEHINFQQNKLNNVKILHSQTNDLYTRQDSLINRFYNLYGYKDSVNDKINLISELRQAELQELILNLIKANPDNFYSLIYLRIEAGMARNTDKEETILKNFEILDNRLKTSKLGIELFTLLNDRIKNRFNSRIGKSAPEFSVKTFEGKTFRNRDLLGQPYLIVFSATWCVPCQKQLPKFVKLYNQYKNKGLKVVYFNVDGDIERWAEHIKKNKLNWINVSERTGRKSEIEKQFHIYAIPSSFLVDRKGKIIYNSDQMDVELVQLESYIKNLIQNK